MKKWAVLGVAALVVYGGGHQAIAGAGATGTGAKAIAYARQQIGVPYCWGGTGGGCFDCSGLVQQAYAHAGVSIARTSQDQWATERHVSTPQPGDLAFFAGSDGTMTSPGHVGIVIGGGQMIVAPQTGEVIQVESYSRPDLVGFTDPSGEVRVKKWLVLGAAAAVLYTGAHHGMPSAVGHLGSVASGPVTRNSNEALANQMAASGYGWTGGQATCLDELWTEESGFSSTAYNSSSGATGIPQLLPGAHQIPANWSDPAVQIKWGLDYINGRYGSPCAAWNHERSVSPNWY